MSASRDAGSELSSGTQLSQITTRAELDALTLSLEVQGLESAQILQRLQQSLGRDSCYSDKPSLEPCTDFVSLVFTLALDPDSLVWCAIDDSYARSVVITQMVYDTEQMDDTIARLMKVARDKVNASEALRERARINNMLHEHEKMVQLNQLKVQNQGKSHLGIWSILFR